MLSEIQSVHFYFQYLYIHCVKFTLFRERCHFSRKTRKGYLETLDMQNKITTICTLVFIIYFNRISVNE